MRLQVYLAHCGVASRRKCEEFVAEGRVRVNGVVATELSTKVDPDDKDLLVEFDNKKVVPEKKLRYVLLNKPKGYICASSNDRGDMLAVDLFKEQYKERLYNVGRLDKESEGLIIFTNDGEFAHKMSHPSSEVEKEYVVDTYDMLPMNLAQDFMRGVRILDNDTQKDVFYRCKSAKELDRRKFCVTLIEGKNKEIRRVFSHYKCAIKRLTRVRIGCVSIGELQTGQFRDLSSAEVGELLAICANGGKNDDNSDRRTCWHGQKHDCEHGCKRVGCNLSQ